MIKSLTIFMLTIILAQEVAGKGLHGRNSNLPTAADVEADAVVEEREEYFEEEYPTRRKVRRKRGNQVWENLGGRNNWKLFDR